MRKHIDNSLANRLYRYDFYTVLSLDLHEQWLDQPADTPYGPLDVEIERVRHILDGIDIDPSDAAFSWRVHSRD